MKRLMTAVLAAGALWAQDNPLSNEVRQSWNRTMNNVVAAAEKMPEGDYGFKPAPESQSFRDLVAHTADSAMGACSGFSGERKTAGARDMTAKADLVGALKAAQAACETAYGSITDAKATEMVESPRGARSRLGTLYQNAIHIEHEYAQMAVHLRLKSLVPPSSEGRGAMGKKGGKKNQ
jgi:hypothetical protein